jgi:hypothetical protein
VVHASVVREWISGTYHCRPHAGLAHPDVPGLDLSPAEMLSRGTARVERLKIPAHPGMVFDFLPVAGAPSSTSVQFKGLGAYSPESGMPITSRPQSLLPRLVLLLNKGTKMAAGLVIRCAGLTVAVSAFRVVAFPLQSLSRGDVRRCMNSPCVVT